MTARRPTSVVLVAVFAVIPCVLGLGLGQYLRWTGTVWLTDAGGFWPVFCLTTSILSGFYVAFSAVFDRTISVSAFLMLTWSWLYVPFWATAIEVPRGSAIVTPDNRVTLVSEEVRPGGGRVWLFAGRGANRIVRHVEGTAVIQSVDVKYRYLASHIATREDGADLSRAVVDALTPALTSEAAKSRSARIRLFEEKGAQERLVADACTTIAKGPCPVRMSMAPQSIATAPGGPWSKYFSEQEAIEERHLPTLVTLLTNDGARVADRDRVFALFMELAAAPSDLARVAARPRLLDDAPFEALIARLLAAPGAGLQALTVYVSVNRLSPEQREALRQKAFREASVVDIIKLYGAGRLTDADIAALAPRLHAEFAGNPEAAIVAIEAFGRRMPVDLQAAAVEAIGRGRAAQALAVFRHVDPSSPFRLVLLARVIADASAKDLETSLSHGRLEELFTPSEARALASHLVAKAATSREWLELATRLVPVRVMTPSERKAIVDELMFVSTKSAMEFVSENRQHLDPADVGDVTRDYAKTVAKDFCLHLTHRNANRQTDYFSDAQMKIFKDCADAK